MPASSAVTSHRQPQQPVAAFRLKRRGDGSADQHPVFPDAVRDLRFSRGRPCNDDSITYSPAYMKSETGEVLRLQLDFEGARVKDVSTLSDNVHRVTLTATGEQLDELDNMEHAVLAAMSKSPNAADIVKEGQTRLTSENDRVLETDDGRRYTVADFMVYSGKSKEMAEMLRKLKRELDGDSRVTATLRLIGPMSFDKEDVFLAWKLMAYGPCEGEQEADSRYESEEEQEEGCCSASVDDDIDGDGDGGGGDEEEEEEEEPRQNFTPWKEFSPAVRKQIDRIRHVHTDLVRKFAEVQEVQHRLTEDMKELIKWSEEMARLKEQKVVDARVLEDASAAVDGLLNNLSPRLQERE